MSTQNFKDWETPWWVTGLVKLYYNTQISLDVAANASNTKGLCFYTIEDNGLRQSWVGHTGLVWCNPPYKNIGLWVDKAIEEANQGAKVVMLVPSSTDTAWFHKALRYGCLPGFVQGRIPFYDPRTWQYGSNPAHANLFLTFGPINTPYINFKASAPKLAQAVSIELAERKKYSRLAK